jgi:hypothetical protein
MWPALERLASRHALSVALSVRAIGLVSLSAFVSLHVQIVGLFGEHGIDSMQGRVDFLTSNVEGAGWLAPSVFLWLDGSELVMHTTCFVGEVASVAMIAGAFGRIAPLLAYAAYLSFVSLGAPFLPLQWDTLLTESLVVAIFSCPLALRRVPLARPPAPHPLALFALWLLLGRLMFASGFVKLASGDDAWWSLEALDYHFETQPLPTLGGYAMHFAPTWMRHGGVIFTFIVELVLPFAILAGTLGRRIAAGGFTLLMLVIGATGNYGFFDLLALALTLSLVDDELIVRVGRVPFFGAASPERSVSSIVIGALASAQMLLGTLALLSTLGVRPYFPESLVALDTAVDPFRVANGYGLFAVMTRDRPIVIFEGSEDGETWHEYDFRWQSGDPARAPAVSMPHMPRLDWMIWFAGLRGEPEPWITQTEIGLLEARPDVLALFGTDPFEGRRPRFVRAMRYDYAFAEPGDPDWWVRSDREPFGPTLERERE